MSCRYSVVGANLRRALRLGWGSYAQRGDFKRITDTGLESLNELKSYRPGSLNWMSSASYNSSFAGQLSAYFRNVEVTDISKMNYYFDARKLIGEGAFATADEALTAVKSSFQSIFRQRGEVFEAFYENRNLMDDFEIPIGVTRSEAQIYFNQLVEDLGSSLYDFIKVQ